MTLAQRLTPRVEIEAFGCAWRIVFTHDCLLEIERLTGADVLAGSLDLFRPSAKALRSILCVVLRSAGCDKTTADVGRLLSVRRIGAFHLAILEGWKASMPEPEPEPAEAKGKPSVHTWMEAWAIARENLGLSSEEWLGMTPRMVHHLSRQRLERDRHREFMLSQLTAVTANFSMGAPKEPFSSDMFMLHPWKAKQAQQTGEDVLRMFTPYLDPDSKKVVDEVLRIDD